MERSTPTYIPLNIMEHHQAPEFGVHNHVSFKSRRSAAFFVLGLLNNMMYVVILTAALELLPSHVPTGVLSFVNITPALLAKALFPYFLKGEIHYGRRVVACTLMAFTGMMVRIPAYCADILR